MEHVLEIATVDTTIPTFTQETHYPFRICDMPIPECNTGFVYMLISLRNHKNTYIGETKCLNTRIKQHNSGYGSLSTAVDSLRPFAIFSYICGFDGRRSLRLDVERRWKQMRDIKTAQGTKCPKQIARSATPVIREINQVEFFNASLCQVFLFKDN